MERKNEANKRAYRDNDKVCSYIERGRTRARQYMDEIGATCKFGARTLFDKIVIDKALDSMMGA